MADEAATKHLDYLVDNRNALMIQASITVLAGAPLLLFVVPFARRIKASEANPDILGIAAAIAISLSWAGVAVLCMFFGGIAYIAESLEPTDARNLSILTTVGYGGPVVLMGTGALFAGLALARLPGVSRFVGWFGVVAGLACAASAFGWAEEGFFSPGPLLFPAYVGFMLWILANAVLMMRGK